MPLRPLMRNCLPVAGTIPNSIKVFQKAFDILANWAAYQTLDPKEIDAERRVVLEEERTGGKNAQGTFKEPDIAPCCSIIRDMLREYPIW